MHKKGNIKFANKKGITASEKRLPRRVHSVGVMPFLSGSDRMKYITAVMESIFIPEFKRDEIR